MVCVRAVKKFMSLEGLNHFSLMRQNYRGKIIFRLTNIFSHTKHLKLVKIIYVETKTGEEYL